MDSVRYLRRAGWTHNLIDIDTYGSPWAHWAAIFSGPPRPPVMGIVLTVGSTRSSIGAMSDEEKIALGLNALRVPTLLAGRLRGMAVDACLTRTCGYRIIEAWEAPNDHVSARYIGVIAERTGTTL